MHICLRFKKFGGSQSRDSKIRHSIEDTGSFCCVGHLMYGFHPQVHPRSKMVSEASVNISNFGWQETEKNKYIALSPKMHTALFSCIPLARTYMAMSAFKGSQEIQSLFYLAMDPVKKNY